MGRNGIKRNSSKISPIAITTSILIGLFFKVPQVVGETLIDRLVAEVNGEAILLSEVQQKVDKGPLIEVSAYPAEGSNDQFELALQDAINFKLIMQRASELEISVSDDRLNDEIQQFLQRRNLTQAELKEALSRQGMTFEQYREDFRHQIIINQFQGREILPSVKVTEKDVEIFYLNKTGNTSDNLKLLLRQLMIRTDQSAAASVKKGKAALIERIKQELKDGIPFEKAARIYSDIDSSRDNGGLMPAIFVKDLAPVFRDAVVNLEEGQFSEPIETPNGTYFFYLEKKEFAGSSEFQRLKPQLEAQLRQEEMIRQTMQWLEEQRRRSEIRVIR